jgi:hypothetical protein
MLVNGIEIDVMPSDGLRGERVEFVDWDHPEANEFLAVNQFTVKGTHTRLRTAVRRVLRKHGYPPDQTENAAQLIPERAEALAEDAVVGMHR